MYVRCPIADFENPRNFIVGKILEVDDFAENVIVSFLDPFSFRNYYENIPEKAELPCISAVIGAIPYASNFINAAPIPLGPYILCAEQDA